MASSKYRQDMPPPGGYQKFSWTRTYPKIVWKGEKIAAVALAITGYGVYQLWALRTARLTEKQEDFDLYNAMTPFLLAERDRRYLKLVKQCRENEEKLVEISGDKAWRVGTWYGEPVYFTLKDRWMDLHPKELFAHVPWKEYDKDFGFRLREDHTKWDNL